MKTHTTSASVAIRARLALCLSAAFTLLSCAEVYPVTEPQEPEPLPSYEEVRSACEPVMADAADNYSSGRFWTFIPLECAEVLGQAFGVDWASFGEEAHELHKAESAGERVIGGLVMATGDQNASVAEVLGADAPPTLADEFEWLVNEAGLDDTTDAGQLWFEFLASSITSIDYEPSNEYTMSYDRSSGRVSVGDITDVIPPDGFPEDTPIWISSARSVLYVSGCFVHEASHSIYGGHGECAGEAEASSYCDPTTDGAYGSGVWWEYEWIQSNIDVIDDTCYEAADAVRIWCEHINEIDDWPACEGFALCQSS